MRWYALLVSVTMAAGPALAQQPPAVAAPEPPAQQQPAPPDPAAGPQLQAAAPAQSPGQPASLCADLLAYAEKKASEPPKSRSATTTAAVPSPNRQDGRQTGTQGGGTTAPTTSRDTSNQPAAPATAPVASGAAPEAAASPHATDQASPDRPSENPRELYGGVTVDEVRQVAGGGDWIRCRQTAQRLRRAGADMPAPLIALAALDPAKQRR